MHVKANIKIASRYLLPLELYMAATMISWGISGGGFLVPAGKLFEAINAADTVDSWLDSNVWWGIGLCAMGGLQLIVTAAELFAGRRWVPTLIFVSVSMRCIAAFFSTVAWIIVLYTQVKTPAMHAIVSMWFQAPLSIIMNIAAYGGNLKVRNVLDATIETSSLEEKIIHKRRNLIPGFRERR